MTGFAAHFAFEFRTGLRNATLLLMYYLFPLAFYALMGVVMTRINPLFQATMLPAMIVFVAMAGPLLGLPSPLVEAREAGIYRTYRISGVPSVAIVGIPGLTAMMHAAIASAIVAVTAAPLFGAEPPRDWGVFAAVAVVCIATFGSIGALIGVISANSRATVLWSQLVFLPSMLIGGLMVPLGLLPPAMLRLAALLPSARAMQAFLGLSYGATTTLDPAVSLVVLAATGLAAAVLSIYLFRWDRASGDRRGRSAAALLVLVPGVVGLFLG